MTKGKFVRVFFFVCFFLNRIKYSSIFPTVNLDLLQGYVSFCLGEERDLHHLQSHTSSNGKQTLVGQLQWYKYVTFKNCSLTLRNPVVWCNVPKNDYVLRIKAIKCSETIICHCYICMCIPYCGTDYVCKCVIFGMKLHKCIQEKLCTLIFRGNLEAGLQKSKATNLMAVPIPIKNIYIHKHTQNKWNDYCMEALQWVKLILPKIHWIMSAFPFKRSKREKQVTLWKSRTKQRTFTTSTDLSNHHQV